MDRQSNSFSHRIKEEITQLTDPARHCKLAELAALQAVSMSSHGEQASMRLISLRGDLGIVADGSKAADVSHIDPLLTARSCCKRAYIRGAFLAQGSAGDPERTYHLEFVSHDRLYLQELCDMINTFELDAKIVKRKSHYVCYLKEGEKIADLLNIIGAHGQLMEFENARIVKEVRNDVNRLCNCENANITKAAAASAKHVSDVLLIESRMGLSSLPEPLKELAELRINNPDSNLTELGQLLSSPLGKSGVNHRLRRLGEIAEDLRLT